MSNLGNKRIMAKNIQRYMDLAGVKAKDVCETLNIPMPTFSDWVNAKTYPRIDTIEMLANYFGISKADLVEECPEIGMDDFTYAMHNHSGDLTDKDKEILLSMAQQLADAHRKKDAIGDSE